MTARVIDIALVRERRRLVHELAELRALAADCVHDPELRHDVARWHSERVRRLVDIERELAA
jgi:hypothetical protein